MQIQNFVELARQANDRPALVLDDAVCTYGELVDGIERWCRILDAAGLRSGSIVGLTGTPCAHMIMALLALAQRDYVAVPFLSANAHETEVALEAACVDGAYHFDAHGQPEWHARRAPPRHPLVDQLQHGARRPGLILFTSGSSGTSKAALHDFARIWKRCDRPERKAARTLAFLMIDHIGGINTLLHVLLAGGSAVFPRDRTVESVCRAIATHRVELLPTTPTFLNMFLLSGRRDRYDLSSLALVTYGTEPMPPSTLLGLKTALPHVRCKQTYGLTETGIVPTKSESDESIWLKVGGPGFETRIVDDVLWIRAETSMLGYLNAPSPFDADGWLNTGDLVEVKDGHLRILGRVSETINVAGEKVSPVEIEDVILQVDNVKDVVVRHKPSPVTGQVVVATVRLLRAEDPRSAALRVRRHCQQQLSPFKVPAIVQVTETELFGRRFKKNRRPDLVAATSELDFTGVA